jgi:hypothetical protein
MADSTVVQSLKTGDSMIEWDSFVTASKQGSIFCKSWWLDTVCPNEYEIILLKQSNRILAGMPIRKIRKFGFSIINLPPFTQTLGILFANHISEKYEKNLSDEIDYTSLLIKALPKSFIYNIAFHFNFTNWLPFYWNGFKQTTYYSYAFEDLTDLNNVFLEFSHAKRKNIKKALGIISIQEDISVDQFYNHHKMTLEQKGSKILYSYDLFKRIYENSYSFKSGKSFYAVDDLNNIHSIIFVIFDLHSAYFLISSIDSNFKDSGSVSLIIKHAIEYVSDKSKRFDFEGSMDPSIEYSFRKFGAKPVPYFIISKSNFFLNILQTLYIQIKSKRFK